MVSAVHRSRGGSGAGGYLASKGLHMVSAVHLYHCAVAQRVAFVASKGLHMVSAVHPISTNKLIHNELCFKGAAHG